MSDLPRRFTQNRIERDQLSRSLRVAKRHYIALCREALKKHPCGKIAAYYSDQIETTERELTHD